MAVLRSSEVKTLKARLGKAESQKVIEAVDLTLSNWDVINLSMDLAKKTKSGRVTTNDSGRYDVVFATAFPNIDYTVALSTESSAQPKTAMFKDLTVNGFTIITRRSENGVIAGNVVVSWLATRNYND